MWGNRVSPRPRPREGLALTQGDGETGFPHPPARGRVWEGTARAQGCGETRFPHTPTRWEGLGGRSPPRKDGHPVGVRREPHGRLR